MSAEGPPIEDQEFLQQFERCTLPFTEWNHRAHLKVAYLYLTAHPLEEAIDCIRRGIKRYNAANNVPEGPQVGYNETTTVAFMHLVHATIRAYGKVLPVGTATDAADPDATPGEGKNEGDKAEPHPSSSRTAVPSSKIRVGRPASFMNRRLVSIPRHR